VHLNLTMSLSTMCGLDNLPAHLAGHGAMTAPWGRTIATAAKSVTLLILDPRTGETIGVSDRTYRPTQRLRDQATTLNETCVWLGCGQPSWRCDLDHVQPFNHHEPGAGGRTTITNLEPACERHHLLKTHGGWTYHRNPDRSLTFTSPTGSTYHNPPEAITLPGEWLHHVPDTPRTGIGLADAEHTQECGNARPQDQPMTIADQVRAYLHREKLRLANGALDSRGRRGAGPSHPDRADHSRTPAAHPECTPDDPAPF
jgi:hypothetical protein